MRFRAISIGKLLPTGLDRPWKVHVNCLEVAAELRCRCPGFVEAFAHEKKLSFRSRAHSWDRLMTWIAGHFFRDAQNEGWFDVILTQARNHPRAIRTMEYADDCDEAGRLHAPKSYLSFQEWRKQADSYLAPAD